MSKRESESERGERKKKRGKERVKERGKYCFRERDVIKAYALRSEVFSLLRQNGRNEECVGRYAIFFFTQFLFLEDFFDTFKLTLLSAFRLMERTKNVNRPYQTFLQKGKYLLKIVQK